jgi:two-component system, cell cycle response regulator
MGKKVLSIDDSKMVHMVVTRALKPLDITVLAALNGQEGIDKARADKPDLIILDITMPIMDGLETLAKLKESPDTCTIPVLMLSADGGKDSVSKALEMGAAHFITKPFTGEALVAALTPHLHLAAAP